MRNEKALIKLLRGLVDLVAEEGRHNPNFAARLDQLMASPPVSSSLRTREAKLNSTPVPDVHAELAARGDVEARHWMRDQPIPVLRAIIRVNDLDSNRRTAKWKDAEKLANFIVDGLQARLARGSAFLGRGNA